nr:hypothetical protein [Dyella sp. ASV24]
MSPSILFQTITFLALSLHSLLAYSSEAEVKTCDQMVTTKPGMGHAFVGHVASEDYRFSVQIPAGSTGWTGVAEDAPFHGFTMFLDEKQQNCIVFDIHVRVDEDERPHHPSYARQMHFGTARGWQWATHGKAAGVPYSNVITTFSYEGSAGSADGEMRLIAPTADLAQTKQKYDKFVRTLSFGR